MQRRKEQSVVTCRAAVAGLALGLVAWACSGSGSAARSSAPADSAHGETPSASSASSAPRSRSELVGSELSMLAPDARDGWGGATRQKLVLRSQNLSLIVPDGPRWQVMSRKGSWSGLIHQASGSELWVRHAVSRRTVTLAECEEQARLSLGLLREPASPAHERALEAPAGYGGTLKVELLPDGGARVVVFGVAVSRCLAVVFRAEERAGFAQRMQVVVNETFAQLAVPSIADRGTHAVEPMR